MSRICNQFYQQKNSTCRQISHKVNRHLSQITVHDKLFLYFGQKKIKKRRTGKTPSYDCEIGGRESLDLKMLRDPLEKVIVLCFVICEKTTISLTHQDFSIHSKQPCSQFQLLCVRPDCPLAISRLFTNHKSQNSKPPPPSPFLSHVRKG